MGSIRRTLTTSLVWRRRRTCCRAGLPCHSVRGTGHDGCLLPGTAAGVCRWVCSQGCPGLSFRAGSLHPRGCVLAQGLCRLPGSPSACPGSSPWRCGEQLWVEGATSVRAGSFCCREGAAWVRVAHSSRVALGISKGSFQDGFPCKGRCLPFEVSHLGRLVGQWDISKGTFESRGQRRVSCMAKELSSSVIQCAAVGATDSTSITFPVSSGFV